MAMVEARPMPNMMTVNEVADTLRVNPSTVLRWIYEQRLGAIKLGRGYRIEREEFDNFVRQGRTRP
jgi:excisionase family DNA binding protein